MANRIVVDPITRIEGHLRIEAEIKDGRISDAWSSGTMVRGFEIILKGRDPRDAWAFTERACGVCTTVHALASVRTVEDALGITVPPNAELIRNLMFCAQYMQDHVVHFYHLHALDWVDVVSALQADPKQTSELAQSISSWPKSSRGTRWNCSKRPAVRSRSSHWPWSARSSAPSPRQTVRPWSASPGGRSRRSRSGRS